jgi:hypothetical protein
LGAGPPRGVQVSKKQRKKLELFRSGADAVHCLNPAHRDLYACPLCRTLWVQEAVAAGVPTLEHVPPASVGGKGIVLTCKVYNNRAGSAIDAALRSRRDFIELGRILHGRAEGSSFSIKGKS